MHNFVLHSNESACIKSGLLELDQVVREKDKKWSLGYLSYYCRVACSLSLLFSRLTFSIFLLVRCVWYMRWSIWYRIGFHVTHRCCPRLYFPEEFWRNSAYSGTFLSYSEELSYPIPSENRKVTKRNGR